MLWRDFVLIDMDQSAAIGAKQIIIGVGRPPDHRASWMWKGRQNMILSDEEFQSEKALRV
jgi:hypothetical protein